ncbi:hypothetical protein MRX96_018278 [Rhipicephalus microplus]
MAALTGRKTASSLPNGLRNDGETGAVALRIVKRSGTPKKGPCGPSGSALGSGRASFVRSGWWQRRAGVKLMATVSGQRPHEQRAPRREERVGRKDNKVPHSPARAGSTGEVVLGRITQSAPGKVEGKPLLHLRGKKRKRRQELPSLACFLCSLWLKYDHGWLCTCKEHVAVY